MDLPCLPWQNHVAEKWSSMEPERKHQFTSLTEIDDVFKFTLTLITQEDLDVVQSISADFSVQKDAEQAAKCRERGNCSFKTKDYTTAALHYSQGVCFAPLSSEQLSLCYANRSAALYHLQSYQESLDDIDKALKSGYPSHLAHKLETRHIQCLELLSVGQNAKEFQRNPASKSQKGPDRVEPLTFGICPGAAVGFSPEKGRHLVAAERIAAGEVILCDRPYSSVLIPGMKEVKGRGGRKESDRQVLFGMEHRRCHRCMSETVCPVPCVGCSYSRYCSTSCQQVAWEEHHRCECLLGADLMIMGVMSQLALRVAFKAGLKSIQTARNVIKDECTQPKSHCYSSFYGDSYSSVFHLLHHLNRHSPEMTFLCAVTVATLYLKLSKSGPPPASWDFSGPSRSNPQFREEEGGITDWTSDLWLLGSAALRHMLQLRCNAQAIVMMQDTGEAKSPVKASQEIRIATAIFPTLSLLNHSCCPNTSLVFSAVTGSGPSAAVSESGSEEGSSACGITATVRAATGIPPGQEILHCYGPHSRRMRTQERRRVLQEQYYFLCQCEACTLQTLQQEEEDKEESVSGLLCAKCKGSLKKSSKDGRVGFKCVKQSCGCGASSSEVSRRLQEIRVDLEQAVDLMERERPDEALKLLKRTRHQSGLILAETHPLQGELADATARAYATMGDWQNAASHLEQSTAAIASQYGEDSIELGQQLFKLAQLHFNGGARDPALSIIPKVRRLLCLHCGPQSHELQELQAMEDCLKGSHYNKFDQIYAICNYYRLLQGHTVFRDDGKLLLSRNNNISVTAGSLPRYPSRSHWHLEGSQSNRAALRIRVKSKMAVREAASGIS